MKHRLINCSHHRWRTAAMSCWLLAAALAPLAAQEPAPAPPAAPPDPAAPAPAQDQPDLVAARFLTTCAGCHTLTATKLTGPGLATASQWPVDQLKSAIKRMEEKVGPLKDEDLVSLADFIKDNKAKDRLAVEQQKMQARFMAKMDPADASLGGQLFTGGKALKNGGLACAGCHSVAGRGGNLGPDLTGIFAKMGGSTPLISAIEKSTFKIMAPHYQRHPVTTQEAIHLAEYFSKIDPAAPVAAAPRFAQAGAGIAGLLLAGLTLYLRGQRASRGRDHKLTRRRK